MMYKKLQISPMAYEYGADMYPQWHYILDHMINLNERQFSNPIWIWTVDLLCYGLSDP